MYGSVSGASAIVPALGIITSTSTPNTTQLTAWLTEGASVIDQYISAAGYVVPVINTASAYSSLTALNDLYGAAYALRARGIEPVTGQQQTLSEMYLKDFFRRLADLVAMDLTLLGLTLVPVASRIVKRRRIRSLQLRRVDGFSAEYEGTESLPLEPSE